MKLVLEVRFYVCMYIEYISKWLDWYWFIEFFIVVEVFCIWVYLYSRYWLFMVTEYLRCSEYE